MDFKRIAPNKSFSQCGLYRTRKLREGIYVAERCWSAGELPKHQYAPWRFMGFGKTEREVRALCRTHASEENTDARAILRDCGLTAPANA